MFTDVTFTDPHTGLMQTAHWPPQVGDPVNIYDWYIQLWRELGKRAIIANSDLVPATTNGNLLVWPIDNRWDWGRSVSSVTDNGDGTVTFGLTLNAANVTNWTVDCEGATPTRWVGYVCDPPGGEQVCVPPHYDFVVDFQTGHLSNTNQVFYSEIKGQTFSSSGPPVTGAGTITTQIGGLLDMITAGLIGSIQDCVGKPWTIITAHGGGGVYTTDRVPQRPMAADKYNSDGTTGTTATIAGVTYSVLYDSAAHWRANQWKNDDLLFYGQITGVDLYTRLKRVSVVSNDAHRIYFQQAAYDAGSTQYCVAKAGAITKPDAPIDEGMIWWSKHTTSYPAHAAADDSIGSMLLATPDGTIPYTVIGEDGNCDQTDYIDDMFDDPDATWATDNICECGNAWLFYSPLGWRDFHAIQKGAIQLAPSFIPPGASDPTQIYTVPSWLVAAGAPGGTSPVVIAGGVVTFTIPSQWVGYPIWYSVANATGGPYAAGQTTPTSTTVTTTIGDTTPTLAGNAVSFSPGFARDVPRMLRNYYDSPIAFIPSRDSDTGGLVDPPQPHLNLDGTYDDSTMGEFVQRLANTSNYSLYDLYGQLQQGAGVALVDGDMISYEGDNQGSVPLTAGGDLAPYWDRLTQTTLASTLRRRRRASMSGRIIGSTKYSITTGEDWWDDGVNDSGIMRMWDSSTSIGTVSLTGTSLTDTSRNTAVNTLPWGAVYSAAIWSGLTSGVLVGWILEIDESFSYSDLAVDATNPNQVSSASHAFVPADVGMQINTTPGGAWTNGPFTIVALDGSGGAMLNASPALAGTSGGTWTMTTTFKIPITSFVDHAGSGGVTFNFAAPDDLTTGAANLSAWRIRFTEAYDKWGGRDLLLKNSAGVVQHVLDVEHNDYQSAFFTPQTEAIDPTWTWEIREKVPGSVWQYSAAIDDLIVPVNPRTHQVPADDQQQLPWQNFLDPTYARDFGLSRVADKMGVCAVQLMNGINLLTDTVANYIWINQSENNHGSGGFSTVNGYSSFAPFKADMLAGVEASVSTSSVVTVPQSSGSAEVGALWTSPTDEEINNGEETTWSAISAYMYGYLSGLCPIFSASADFYTYCGIDAGDDPPTDTTTSNPTWDQQEISVQFDASGQNVAYHAWEVFATGVGVSGGTGTSPALGSSTINTTILNDFTDIVLNNPGGTYVWSTDKQTSGGYYVLQYKAIVHWDF